MAQKISQMTEQTTASMTEAGTSDFLGGYTATGGNANRKFSLSGLANYFLNKFKMTLGGSSQTVKSAIDALNSKKRPYFSEATFTSGADLNQIFYGTYCCNTSALHNSILHKPTGMVTSIWRFTVVPLTNDGASNPTAPANWSRRAQIIYTGETEYWRVYQVDGSGNIDFGDWVETPKRSEITAINSKTDVGITAAEGVQLSSTSKICVTGTYIFIYVKGKALETKTNAQLCTFGGNKNVYTACTVPIGLGDSEWDISSTGYGFISGKSIVGRVQENKWFHIFITIPFA